MTYVWFEWNNKKLCIDSFLSEVMASVVWNCKTDNDAVVVVSGSRMVRSGKSTIAQTCAAFCAYLLKRWEMNKNAFTLDNIYFNTDDMIEKVTTSNDKHNVYVLDEIYQDLSSTKVNAKQQKVLDFFNEVGFKNNIYFMCIADFFSLKEVMAVGRSECLINTYRRHKMIEKDYIGDGIKRNITVFERGFFQFWNREAKNLMFDIYRTANKKSYFQVKTTFPNGSFADQLPFPKEEYVAKKENALQRFKAEASPKTKETKDATPTALSEKKLRINEQRDKAILLLQEKTGMSNKEICKFMDMNYYQWDVAKRKIKSSG